MEITFNLFDVELEEMISLVKEKGSYLILSTAPINISIPPKTVCLNSSTELLEDYQIKLEAEIKKGNHKVILNKARELTTVTLANARSFFILGQAALGAGRLDEARSALTKAAAFDCGNWRAHPVFNAIIKKKSSALGVKLIDFNNIVNRHLGYNELFFTDHKPQEIYYNHYLDEVYVNIKVKLKL